MPGQGASRNSSASWWMNQSAFSSFASSSLRFKIAVQSKGGGPPPFGDRFGNSSISRRPRPSHDLACSTVASVERLSIR